MAGENVIFQLVRDGADGGETCTGGTVIAASTVQTEANGQATYSFTRQDPSTANTADTNDCVYAFHDADSDGVRDSTEDQDAILKTWSDDAAAATTLEATPETDTNLINTNHTVTTSVEDQFGGDGAGETVRSEVYRETTADGEYNRVVVATRTAGTNGDATFTYAGPAAQADDVIVVCTATRGPNRRTEPPADALVSRLLTVRTRLLVRRTTPTPCRLTPMGPTSRISSSSTGS